jgi:hypothetical protein
MTLSRMEPLKRSADESGGNKLKTWPFSNRFLTVF